MSSFIDPDLAWSDLKKAFEEIDLPEFKSLAGSTDTFTSINSIYKWAGELKRDCADSFRKNQQNLVAKEIEAIWLERQKAAPELNPPIGARSLGEIARERVQNRFRVVMSSIDITRQTMVNKMIELNRSEPKAKQSFSCQHDVDVELHALNNRANNIRKQICSHFENTRSQKLLAAISNGSTDPSRDVTLQLSNKLKRVNQIQSKMQADILNKHGLSRTLNTPTY